MKSFIALAAVSFGLLLSFQSCLTCTSCRRRDLEAKCVKPNDTLIFNQYEYQQIHRYYSGGDSIFSIGESTFDHSIQKFTDSGYICSVYATGKISEVKRCNQAGEGDDDDYSKIHNYEQLGYTCFEYKGH